MSFENTRIGIRSWPTRGRGVVALCDVAAGSTLERSPVIIIPPEHRRLTDATVIFHYVFMWEHGSVEDDLYDGWGRAAITLGLSSLLNHSKMPNAAFIRHIDELELELRSIRPIEAGEEVTIDYQMRLWFDPRD
jgi:SET domain-containing protein